MATEVTARDVSTGESETRTITDDWNLVCDGRAYVHHIAQYPKSGTTVITIKCAPAGEAGS